MQNSLSSPQKSVQKTQHAQMNDRENIPNTCHTVTVVSYQHFATISKDLNSYGGGGSRPPSNTWLLGPTAPHTPNAISIEPAVFAGYLAVTSQTDRHTHTHTHTDHATHQYQ